MKFVDYLFESKIHPNGTYSALLPSRESRDELFAYCNSLGIENLVDQEEHHCTVIYSHKECPDAVQEDFALPCKAIPKGFEVFGKDKKVLVLSLYCPNATRLHNVFREKYGATHDFPEYHPHITVAKDFTGEIPTDIPDFDIEFTGFMLEEMRGD